MAEIDQLREKWETVRDLQFKPIGSQPPATGDGEEPITFDELLDDFAELRKLGNAELTDRLRQILHSYVSAAVQEAVNKLKLDARTLMQGCGFTTIQYEEDDFTLLHAYECGDDHHLCRSCQRRLDALVSAEMLQEKV